MVKLIKFSDLIVRLTHHLAAILLAVAALLVFYQVFTRFILGDSAGWSEVLARAVIIWGVFLVFGPAVRSGRMIPIDAIRNMISPAKQIWIIRLVTIATMLVLLVLIWFGSQMTLRVIHQQVAMLDISVAWFYAAMPTGSLLAIPGVFLAHLDAETSHRKLSKGSAK